MSAVDILSVTEVEVRDALPDDVHAISAIYAWHVLHGRASFEEIPTVDEMRKRLKNVTDNGLPGWWRCIAALWWAIATPRHTVHDTRIASRWKSQSTWMPVPPDAVLVAH